MVRWRSFLLLADARLAQDTLLVGKSINFIRVCCDDNAWVLELTNELRSTYPRAALLASGHCSPLALSASDRSSSVHQRERSGASANDGEPVPDVGELRPLIRNSLRLVNARVMDLIMNEHRCVLELCGLPFGCKCSGILLLSVLKSSHCPFRKYAFLFGPVYLTISMLLSATSCSAKAILSRHSWQQLDQNSTSRRSTWRPALILFPASLSGRRGQAMRNTITQTFLIGLLSR